MLSRWSRLGNVRLVGYPAQFLPTTKLSINITIMSHIKPILNVMKKTVTRPFLPI